MIVAGIVTIEFAKMIVAEVEQKFGVRIVPEINIVG